MVDDGSDGVVSLEYKIGSLPENFEKAANEAALLKRNCFAAVFEKYFEAQVSLYLEFLSRTSNIDTCTIYFTGDWLTSEESSYSLQTRRNYVCRS